MPIATQNIYFSYPTSGGLLVLGEIRNESGDILEQVRVGVTFLDAQEKILAEGDGLAMLDLVLPGEVAPFTILFAETLSKFERYHIYPLSAVPAYVGGYYRDLVVEDLRRERERYESYTVRGTVRNTGKEETVSLQVILTAYDSMDRVIATRKIVPDHNVVAPGGETTFTAILVPMGGPVARIHVAAQGRRYAVNKRNEG